MIQIPYSALVIIVTAIWILVRGMIARKNGCVSWKRELQLMLVYICIVVVVRFTFIPGHNITGKLQPLLFDPSNIYPFRINLLPLVHLFDYPDLRDTLVNIIGNSAMFLPLGIVWPSVFKELNTPGRALAAGIGCSLCIEILQLPFFDRVSDVDDLILNTLGYAAGYGIYRLVTAKKRKEVTK